MSRPLSIAVLVVALAVAPAGAASPTEELLRYVPEDVAFCVAVQDVRGHASRLGDSPFVEQFRKSPLGKALLASPEMQQLLRLEEQLATQFKLDWKQLRDDVFGDAVVLAYRPGPPGKPEKEEGLILVRARNAEALNGLIDRLNKMMKDAGTLKELQQREHDGQKYWRRLENKEETFYLVRGPVLVLSGQERMLRQALVQEKKLSAEQPSPLGKRLAAVNADKALAGVWINPRAFDAELDQQRAAAQGDEAAFLETFGRCWKALDDVGLALHLDKELELSLSLRAQPDKLPVEVRRFVEKAAEMSELWARFSQTPLLALGAKTDLASLAAVLALLQTKESYQAAQDEINRGVGAALGKNVVREVLPHVGPDWGLCVTAPPASEKNWFPSTVLAIRVAPGDPNEPVDRALLDTIHSYAVIAVMAFNKQNKERLSIKTVRHDKLELRYLSATGGLPSGLQPAYALHGGYLLLASSPEVLRRFTEAVPRKQTGDEVPLVRLSGKEWRRFLASRREPLSAFVAEQQQLTAKEAGQRLDNLAALFQFLDQLDLSVRPAKGQATFTLRLRTAAPLRP